MFLPIMVISLAAIILVVINWKKGQHLDGLRDGAKQLFNVLPLIAVALVLAGMVEALIPEEFVMRWLAYEAGYRGVFLGTLGGMCLAMGPYAAFPIIASIYNAGAGLGTTVSIFVAWALLGLYQFPYEASIFGLKFALTKIAFGLPFSLLAGGVAYLLEPVLFN